LEQNQGAAMARNAGAKVARGDIILFLDADVEVPWDLIGRVQALFVDNPGMSACIGSYDAEPAACGLVSQFRNLLHHYLHQKAKRVARTFWTKWVSALRPR
jgi:cellulose synthase/poly-beta-1,6-N-acetylglucosamine synthase-like glycosyltransferase